MDLIHQTKINNKQLRNNKSWYAIYVKSRHEKCVHSDLREKGIESSVPIKKVYRQWSDRKKKVEVPFFRGYVFIKIDIQKERLDVLKTDGVIKFITFGGRFIVIPEEQMYWLDRLLPESSIEYEQEFPAGCEVEVIIGPFKGIQGRIKKKNIKTTRLIVWIDTIMQGISIEIDPVNLQELKQKSIDSVPSPLEIDYQR